jgi:hypothetical protein
VGVKEIVKIIPTSQVYLATENPGNWAFFSFSAVPFWAIFFRLFMMI